MKGYEMAKSVGQLHWDYFLLLEEDLAEAFKYIELDERNDGAYGSKLAKLFLSVCSEVDVALKDLVALRDYNNDMLEKKSNIDDYRVFVQREFADEFRCSSVTFARSGYIVRPWGEWWNGRDDSNINPSWWKSYNQVKHHRSESYHEANLKNVASAFAALFVVVVCLHREELKAGGPTELRPTQMTEFVDDGGALGSNAAYEFDDGCMVLHDGFHAVGMG